MSLNHILKDVVPDDEKLDVKFGIVEADSMVIDNSTFTNLTVSNELTVGGSSVLQDVQAQNIVTTNSANIGNSLVVNSFIRSTTGTVQAKSGLFKSEPYLNSTTIGVSQILTVEQTVNGMIIFDDTSKTTFDYKMPYKSALDAYLGLSGTQTYAFHFNVAVFSTISTGSSLSISADAVSGVSFNYVGTYTKVVPHATGRETGIGFVCVRQTDGTYIAYG